MFQKLEAAAEVGRVVSAERKGGSCDPLLEVRPFLRRSGLSRAASRARQLQVGKPRAALTGGQREKPVLPASVGTFHEDSSGCEGGVMLLVIIGDLVGLQSTALEIFVRSTNGAQLERQDTKGVVHPW